MSRNLNQILIRLYQLLDAPLFLPESSPKCAVSQGTHRTTSGPHHQQLTHVDTTKHLHPQHDSTCISHNDSSRKKSDSTASEFDDEAVKKLNREKKVDRKNLSDIDSVDMH